MKKLILLLLLIPSLAWGQVSTSGVSLSGCSSGGVSAAACTDPTGSIYTDGFETDNSANWTLTAGVTYQVDVSAKGTPSSNVCTYGMYFTSTGTIARGYHDIGTTRSEYYARIPIYIESSSVSNFDSIEIFRLSADTAGAGGICSIRLYKSASGWKIKADGADTATISDILAEDTWYVVDVYAKSNDATSQVSLDGIDGSTHQHFTGLTSTSNRYVQAGLLTGSRTADIYFGYVAVDADGAY
jgi:hypothetical protein